MVLQMNGDEFEQLEQEMMMVKELEKEMNVKEMKNIKVMEKEMKVKKKKSLKVMAIRTEIPLPNKAYEVEQELKEMRMRMDRQDEKIGELKKQVHHLTDENIILKDENTILKKENIILKKQMDSLKDENTILKKQMDSLMDRVDDLTMENMILRKRVSNLYRLHQRLLIYEQKANIAQHLQKYRDLFMGFCTGKCFCEH